MKVELDLWSSTQLDAFGDFCKALAAAQKADENEKLDRYGGIAAPSILGGALTPVQPPVDNAHVADGAQRFTTEEVAANAPKRERGKPAPGRARRTKEEIAEDDAAVEADRAAGLTPEPSQISTNPENRVGAEDDAETQAQDAADEQAEVDANRDAEAPLTIEDLKMAMSEYVTKFDMGAAQEDGVNIFGDALGKPPGGEQFWKMSIAAAAGQDTLKKAIAAWKAAAAADKRYVKAGA